MQTTVNKQKWFTVWNDEINGILSPAFVNHFKFADIETYRLGDVAEVNPSRKVVARDVVPYVGLPETSDKRINTILYRPIKQVSGRQIIQEKDILFARIEPSIFNKKYIYVDSLKGENFAYTSTEFLAIKANDINPRYLFFTLFTDFVYNQFAGKTTGSTGRRRLEKSTLLNIRVPKISKALQDEIVSKLEKIGFFEKPASDSTRLMFSKLLENKLDIKIPQTSKADKWFVVWNDEVNTRLDSSPYHPDRMSAMRAVGGGTYPVRKLNDVVDFQKSQVKKLLGKRYIGLENITSNIGELIESTQNKTSVSSASVFSKGDILFAKLRPYLNKVYLAEFDGVCSTEFHVLSCKSTVLPEYLRAFLASDLVVRQTSHLMTGNTLPRLQTEDIRTLQIPIPDISVQEKIVADIKLIQKRAKSEVDRLVNQKQETLAEIDRLIFGNNDGN